MCYYIYGGLLNCKSFYSNLLRIVFEGLSKMNNEINILNEKLSQIINYYNL